MRGESPCALDPTVPSGPEPYGGESQICPAPTGGDRSYADKRKEIIGKAISAWNKRRNPGATGPAWAPRRPQAGRLQTRPDPASLTSGSPYPVPRSGNHHHRRPRPVASADRTGR